MAGDFNPGMESVAQTASPNLQMTQARNDPNSVGQLMHALGMAQPGVDKITETFNQNETQSGAAYANSLTVEELGKKVKSGELLPSQSPAYVATVQHIYGQNSMEQQQRDTLSQISRGELSFSDNAAIDAYLVKQRNAALVGQSKYTIAGFDKGWDTFGKQAVSANARVNDAVYVARGIQEGSDHLLGTLEAVSGKDFAGSTDEAAAQIINQYTMLRVTGVLGLPDQQKAALSTVLSEVAGAGKRDLLTSLLKQSTVDGPTLASIMGGERSRHLVNAAHAADDVTQRQRVDVELRPFLDAAVAGDLTGAKRTAFEDWVTKNESWVTTPTRQSVLHSQRSAEDHLDRANNKAEVERLMAASLGNAQQQVDAALVSGTYAGHPPITILNRDGTLHPFQADEYAITAIPRLAAQAKLGFVQEAMMWSAANVVNPQWKGLIASASSNIASVGWAADGKNVGQLNEAGKKAIQMYSELYQVNPALADEYAGKDSKMLGKIRILQQKLGFPDVNAAAALVNQSMHSGIGPTESAVNAKDISAAVSELTDNKFFSLTNQSTVQWVKGLFGGTVDLNRPQISADIREYAQLLLESRGAPDAKTAVKYATEYLSKSMTKVNGTMYYTKDLPKVPQGENQGELLEKFIEQGPAEMAAEHGLDKGQTRLEPDAQGNFTAWVGGVPLQDRNGSKVVYQRSEIENWIQDSATRAMLERGAKRNLDAFSERMRGNFRQQGLLQKYPDITPGVISFHGQPVSVKELLSKNNYDRLKAEGIAAGTAEEIITSTLNARKKKK